MHDRVNELHRPGKIFPMQHVKRTVLVTGASSGIGRACAVALLNQGHKVIGLSRDCQKFTTDHPSFSSVEIDFK